MILPQHLRYVWRIMRWSPSVQVKYFIPVLRDYFSEQVRRWDTSNNTVSAPPSPSLTAQTTEDDEPPMLSNDEEWCLKYLGITYVPALRDTFDDNANGLVSIREVNAFSQSKSMPESWSILKRLAYAAIGTYFCHISLDSTNFASGWHLELSRYGQLIQMIYNTMILDAESVLPGTQCSLRVIM